VASQLVGASSEYLGLGYCDGVFETANCPQGDASCTSGFYDTFGCDEDPDGDGCNNGKRANYTVDECRALCCNYNFLPDKFTCSYFFVYSLDEIGASVDVTAADLATASNLKCMIQATPAGSCTGVDPPGDATELNDEFTFKLTGAITDASGCDAAPEVVGPSPGGFDSDSGNLDSSDATELDSEAAESGFDESESGAPNADAPIAVACTLETNGGGLATCVPNSLEAAECCVDGQQCCVDGGGGYCDVICVPARARLLI